MKSTIICIGRQYGSGGREIGEKLAERLGVVCYDKLIIGQTAKEAGLSAATAESDEEKPIGLCEIVSGNPFADSALLGATFYSEKQRVFEAESKTILEIADKGPCGIIGRCASSILRGAGYDVLIEDQYEKATHSKVKIVRHCQLSFVHGGGRVCAPCLPGYNWMRRRSATRAPPMRRRWRSGISSVPFIMRAR